MSESGNLNKRIVKNSLYMYVRMLFTMGVSLYTSRVVLTTLGVSDFGIFNVVAGVVVLFSFLNNAMSTSTQRYLSYELGKTNGSISSVFSSCLYIHICLSVLVLVLLETVGLWFINNRMNFPEERMYAVNWCYQFSVLSCIVGIIRVPYNGIIIAKENFSFYAYLGILEAVLKLLIVYLLLLSEIDKLLMYSFLMCCVVVLVNVICFIYCRKSFPEIKCIKFDRNLNQSEILSFSGWAFLGSLANVGLSQGINIIINIFYGVFVNAAFGIANQIYHQVTALVSGFQQALNPQLTKSEAEGNRDRQFSLICMSSKFSFIIMLIFVFPIILNLDYVLHLWLGNFPIFTYEFSITILIGALIETLSGPLWVTIFASGNIKNYQIVISILLLLNVPISYLLGYLNLSPILMFVSRNVIYVFALIVRLIFLKKLINMNVFKYLRISVFPVIFVSLLLISVYFIPENLRIADCFSKFIIVSFAVLVFESILIWIFVINRDERTFITNYVKQKLRA